MRLYHPVMRGNEVHRRLMVDDERKDFILFQGALIIFRPLTVHDFFNQKKMFGGKRRIQCHWKLEQNRCWNQDSFIL